MTRRTKNLILMATLLLAIPSCKKDRGANPDEPQPDPTPINLPLKDAKIALPTGVSYDLSGHELMAFGVIQPVGNDGSTKTVDIKGATNVGYLFDKDKNPILAGFITDSTSTLSVESTAKVLLYYASGAAFMRDTVGNIFINRAHEINGVVEWINEFAELWKANPKILSTGAYNTALQAKVNALFNDPPAPNAGIQARSGNQLLASNRLTDILVDNNDIRSGLQVAQGEVGNIIISNYYRRRAHAFFYKTKYKPKGSEAFRTILSNIGTDTDADRDMAVEGSSGATSMSGTAIKLINGKGMDFAVAHTGPINMELEEHEDEAVYQVHIVGVGNSGSTKTRAEHDKKERLIIETFALDFVMPLIGSTIGALGEEQKGDFVSAVDKFVKAAPVVYDALNSGDFKKGVLSVFEAANAEALNYLLEGIGEILYEKAGQKNKDYLDRAKNIPVLKVTDGILQGLDWGLITGYILASKQMESWEITVRKSQVRLEPKEAKTIPFAQVRLNAIAKNIEESQKSGLSYKWRTTGKYGYLIDTKGNQGNAFESADQQISYNCNASLSSLGDENIEQVYVDVYLNGELLGSDSTQINVQKSGYAIRPNGITVTGKKGTNGTQAKLFLKPIDWNAIPEIGPNDKREYKVVWSTSGKHGGLIAPGGGDILKAVTTYDDRGVVYECTDDNTRIGSETITARIYSRDKNATDEPFRLFDEVTGSVRINNDPKTRIVHLPVELMRGDQILWNQPHRDSYGNTYYTHQCYQVLGATFQQNPEDAHYSITFYTAGGRGYTESGSWKAGDPITGFTHGDNHPAYDGSTYRVGTGLGGWSVGPYYPDQPTPSCNHNGTLSGEDTCVLTITLK